MTLPPPNLFVFWVYLSWYASSGLLQHHPVWSKLIRLTLLLLENTTLFQCFIAQLSTPCAQIIHAFLCIHQENITAMETLRVEVSRGFQYGWQVLLRVSMGFQSVTAGGSPCQCCAVFPDVGVRKGTFQGFAKMRSCSYNVQWRVSGWISEKYFHWRSATFWAWPSVYLQNCELLLWLGQMMGATRLWLRIERMSCIVLVNNVINCSNWDFELSGNLLGLLMAFEGLKDLSTYCRRGVCHDEDSTGIWYGCCLWVRKLAIFGVIDGQCYTLSHFVTLTGCHLPHSRKCRYFSHTYHPERPKGMSLSLRFVVSQTEFNNFFLRKFLSNYFCESV